MRNENSAAASVATTSVNTKKLALAAVFAAIAVVGSTFSVPVFGSKCAPVQHLVNVLCAVFLGPAYGVAAAFIASVIRNLMGLGSLLAFPGCAVVVSHDRMFLDRIATHILAWEGDDENPGRWHWFEGNFDSYQTDRVARLGQEASRPHRLHRKLTRD